MHFGGPVQTERGFVLHDIPQKSTQTSSQRAIQTMREEYNSTVLINNSVALTTSKDILEAVARDSGLGETALKANSPQKMLVALGYAGWTAGQLEQELAQNAWLNLETSNVEDMNTLIFDTPNHQKFDLAMRLMGLDLAHLSDVAGHA